MALSSLEQKIVGVLEETGTLTSAIFIKDKLFPNWSRQAIDRALVDLSAEGVVTASDAGQFYTLTAKHPIDAPLQDVYRQIYAFVESQKDEVSSDLIRKTMIRRGWTKNLISEALTRLVDANRITKQSLNKRIFYTIVKIHDVLPMSPPTPPPISVAAEVNQTLTAQILAFLKARGNRAPLHEIVTEMRKHGFERRVVNVALKTLTSDGELYVDTTDVNGISLGYAIPAEKLRHERVDRAIRAEVILKCLAGSLEKPKERHALIQKAYAKLWFGETRTPEKLELLNKTFDHLVETKKIRKVLGPNDILQGYVSQQEIDGVFPPRETMDQTRQRLDQTKKDYEKRLAAQNLTPWFKYRIYRNEEGGCPQYDDCVLTQNIGPYVAGMIIPRILYYDDLTDGSLDHILEIQFQCEKDRRGNYTYTTVYACLVKSMLGESLPLGPDGPILD